MFLIIRFLGDWGLTRGAVWVVVSNASVSVPQTGTPIAVTRSALWLDPCGLSRWLAASGGEAPRRAELGPRDGLAITAEAPQGKC